MQGTTRAVIRDVVLLFVLTGIGGFLIGIATYGQDIEEILPLIGLSNIIFSTLGFFISGCLVAKKRFIHLRAVAIIVWLSSIFNVFLFEEFEFSSWLFSIIIILITMLIGGYLSFLFVPGNSTNSSAPNSGGFQGSYLSINQWIIGIASGVITNLIVKGMTG